MQKLGTIKTREEPVSKEGKMGVFVRTGRIEFFVYWKTHSAKKEKWIETGK